MSLTKLTENVNVHQSLPDKPTLSAAELKQAFDSAADTIKTYLNTTLSSELDTIIANLQSGDTTMQQAITQIQSSLNTATSNITAIQTTLAGLKSGATTKITIGSSVPSSLSSGEVYLQYFS